MRVENASIGRVVRVENKVAIERGVRLRVENEACGLNMIVFIGQLVSVENEEAIGRCRLKMRRADCG